MDVELEVCCDNIDAVRRAAKGGATRVELCSALVPLGGLTPSTGLVVAAKDALDARGIAIHCMVRPRPGDFILSDDDLEVMKHDIRAFGRMREASEGAASTSFGASSAIRGQTNPGPSPQGVVLGALTPNGTIDAKRLGDLVKVAREWKLEVTFHRAIDKCPDVVAAYAELKTFPEVTRVLTSGGASTAVTGLPALRGMIALDHQRGSKAKYPTVMVGAGVASTNAASLVRALGGKAALHGSFKREVVSQQIHRSPNADQVSPPLCLSFQPSPASVRGLHALGRPTREQEGRGEGTHAMLTRVFAFSCGDAGVRRIRARSGRGGRAMRVRCNGRGRPSKPHCAKGRPTDYAARSLSRRQNGPRARERADREAINYSHRAWGRSHFFTFIFEI